MSDGDSTTHGSGGLRHRPVQTTRWRWAADLLTAIVFVRIAALYLTRLTAWRINDDEGSYLYAAWRVALGELPYRDFLTPQLPAFLMPGGLLMRIAGTDAWTARAAVVVLTLLAAVLLWWTVRRLLGPWVAGIAAVAMLLHPDVFSACRTFRPEPVMLALQIVGTWAFARAVFRRPATPQRVDRPDRRWLALAGAVFGLATLAKLFGPWPLGGLLFWLIDDARRGGRPWRDVAGDIAVAFGSCVAVVAVGLGGFRLLTAEVFEATVTHHVRQGAGQTPWEILSDGGAMFAVAIRDANRAVPMVMALAVFVVAWRRGDRASLLWGWQLPTALALLVLSRERYPRHLLYLAPAIGVLFAVGVTDLWRAATGWGGTSQRIPEGSRADDSGARADDRAAGADRSGTGWLPRAVSLALVVAVLGAWFLYDRDYFWAREEDGTEKVSALIQLITAPEELVLSDYSELNFYARRPTTYSAASLSSGAVGSGQITWARMAGELEERGTDPALLVLETDSPDSHLARLSGTDRADFHRWVDSEYAPAGVLRRGPQRYAVHVRATDTDAATDADAPLPAALPLIATFDDGLELLAGAPQRREVVAGESLVVDTAWRAPQPPEDDVVVTVRVLDPLGRTIAQGDAGLFASPDRPTSAWNRREMTAQRLTLDLPPGLPANRYSLWIGAYDRADGELHEAIGPGGRVLGRFVPVAEIQALPWRPADPESARRSMGLRPPPTGLAEHAPAGWDPIGIGAPVSSTVVAGDVVRLPTAWRWQGDGDPDGHLFVELAPEDPGSARHGVRLRVAPEQTMPSTWPDGTVVLHELRIPVPVRAVAGTYTIVITEADGDSPAEVQRIQVHARDLEGVRFDPPTLDAPIDARIGSVGRLLGASFPELLQVGTTTVDVTLTWRAIAPSPLDYSVTVQLLDADGRPVAAHDGFPTDGGTPRPTSRWLADEVIVDEHEIVVPEGLAEGSYTLVAAMYRPISGERLPVTAGNPSTVAPGLIELGEVLAAPPVQDAWPEAARDDGSPADEP